MKKLYNFMMRHAAALTLAVAVVGAGARCTWIFHEPKVPAKLRKD
ncbi:MAG: cyclic lactone autoinducer peptide [Oscillospiraceae bacterium]|nr:cyclic lactone autoinducer peptide [Oscillospiraceae bacterium]